MRKGLVSEEWKEFLLRKEYFVIYKKALQGLKVGDFFTISYNDFAGLDNFNFRERIRAKARSIGIKISTRLTHQGLFVRREDKK